MHFCKKIRHVPTFFFEVQNTTKTILQALFMELFYSTIGFFSSVIGFFADRTQIYYFNQKCCDLQDLFLNVTNKNKLISDTHDGFKQVFNNSIKIQSL